MASELEGKELRPLSLTPTFYISIVLAIYIIVSAVAERLVRCSNYYLRNANMKYLVAAIDTIKKEIGFLGFLSLILAATSTVISHMCIPSKYKEMFGEFTICTLPKHSRRNLAEDDHTCKENYEPFMSVEALDQLHLFIFVLAITQVLYSSLALYLATKKIRNWRVWENEARLDVPNPIRKNTFFVWMICFFRSLGRSVVRIDYLTFRRIFIMNHDLPLAYDFHDHIIHSLEENFPRLVNVNLFLWMFAIIFTLVNVMRFKLYLWIPLTSVVLLLVVATKLRHVLTTSTLRATHRTQDQQFWFNKPKLLFFMIQFILFQNGFELASFLWILWQFGISACNVPDTFTLCFALLVGLAGLVLCSYNILPLYVLVTQKHMGVEEEEEQELREIYVGRSSSNTSEFSFKTCDTVFEREVGAKSKHGGDFEEAPLQKKLRLT